MEEKTHGSELVTYKGSEMEKGWWGRLGANVCADMSYNNSLSSSQVIGHPTYPGDWVLQNGVLLLMIMMLMIVFLTPSYVSCLLCVNKCFTSILHSDGAFLLSSSCFLL